MHGEHSIHKVLPIEQMQCTFAQGTLLLIGAANKVYLIDMALDFKVVSQCQMKRLVISICAMGEN